MILNYFFIQYPLGLFDCNENKTPELIRLLKTLSTYVPCRDGEVVEPVFFGGLFSHMDLGVCVGSLIYNTLYQRDVIVCTCV